MTFNPMSVDMSEVEPAFSDETLERIVVLEEFRRSRGVAARRKACEALGLTVHQLYVLSRAWGARHRAEDVGLRATKRSRPTSVPAAMIELIGDTADAMPGATTIAIAAAVREKAAELGLAMPTYPTVSRYVRQRTARNGRALIEALPGNLHVDVTVSDIPVAGANGTRVKAHLLMLVDGATASLAALAAIPGDVTAADVATLLASAAKTALLNDRAGVDTSTAGRAPFPSVTLPVRTVDANDVARLLAPAGFATWTRDGAAARPGYLADAMFGVSHAGYRLRPRLVGRPAHKRIAGHPKLAAAAAADAARYLAAVARSQQAAARENEDQTGTLDAIDHTALRAAIEALTPACIDAVS